MAAVPSVPERLLSPQHTKRDSIHNENAGVNATQGSVDYEHGSMSSSEFTLHDHPVENFRPLRIIVVGAGYSGVYCGIRIPERIKNCDLVIYEKNAGIGGTWFENRYPGCACDVPSHSYQYSFNPNPNWSALYAPATEICQYIEDTARKYAVHRFVKLQHKVETCTYNASETKWHVVISRPDGRLIHDTCDVLISARGNLNDIAWPKIEGLDKFEGEVMHSALWNQSYDFTSKRVGVIGVGSSAIQIIPNLRNISGIHLDCFVRGRTWISPPFAQEFQDETGMTGITFSDSERQKFRDEPKHLHDFRRKIEISANKVHPITVRGTPLQKSAEAAFEDSMRQKLAKRPDIFEKIKPSFAPGCRRLTPGPGFLEALVEDNVSFISDKIEKIAPKGIVTSDGKLHEIDVLVCATGFHASSAPPFPVRGLFATLLSTHWSIRSRNYLSVATDSFPNMFMILGPNAAIGSGSLTLMIEATGDYITKCIRKMQKEDIASMTVKRQRVDDFAAYSDAYFATTVFTDQCRSWYRTGDVITGLWPGSALHCIETLRSPRWEDWEYEPRHKGGNPLAWLGNGYSAAQLDPDADLAWYLRPDCQVLPHEGKPEDNEMFKARPFSH